MIPSGARAKYASHKAGAAARGLEFEFTFEEWWEIWEPHFHNRGVHPDQLQMCRTRDEGGYTHGNVRIDTAASNQRERTQTMMRRDFPAAWEQPDMTPREAFKSAIRRDSFWGGDYFRKLEYAQEHCEEYLQNDLD